jgi:hypothetical protein
MFFFFLNFLFVMSITFDSLDQGWARQNKMSQKQGLGMTLDKAKTQLQTKWVVYGIELGNFHKIFKLHINFGTWNPQASWVYRMHLKGSKYVQIEWYMGKTLMIIINFLHYYWYWGTYHQDHLTSMGVSLFLMEVCQLW